MTYPKLPDELYDLERAIYECKNIIYDIKVSEKHSDDLDGALNAISTLYKLFSIQWFCHFFSISLKLYSIVIQYINKTLQRYNLNYEL